MNLNAKQIIALVVVVLGVLTASTAQLTDIFGPSAAKLMISVAGILNSILAGVLSVISSQTGIVKDVQAMQGIDSLIVNSQANSTLASMALDPAQNKIVTKRGSEEAVRVAAQG
jgi:hypothetical protein